MPCILTEFELNKKYVYVIWSILLYNTRDLFLLKTLFLSPFDPSSISELMGRWQFS